MCLEFGWFKEAGLRKRKRDEEGVSISEAVDCLSMYHSTVYPIGSEMAAWIFNNWTLEQIYELPENSRKTLFEIVEDLHDDINHSDDEQSEPLEIKTWVDWVTKAIENLGGTAYLDQIYSEIENLRPSGLTRHWRATVRNIIESHSSDSYNYKKPKQDLFYSVGGIGSGYWGLRRMKI